MTKASKRRAGIVGLGLMGTSIAACLAGHGFDVVGVDRDRARARRAGAAIRRMIREMDSPRSAGRVNVTTSIGDLKQCDVVVEAIVEDLEAKRALIAELERVVSSRAIVASNTSAIPIALLQSRARHPQRIIGMHWAEPAHLTRFMEIICGAKTSKAACRRAKEIAIRCGKEPSMLRKDVRGFITNRIFYAMLREAFHLVESGVCDVADVDRSMRNDLGWWITLAGPFRFMDLTGIPAYETVMKHLWPELSNSKRVPPLMRKIVASGAKGVTNAKGFYRYSAAEARAWQRRFAIFSLEIRALAMKYPDDGRI